MIEEYYELAMKIANKYARLFPNKSDDIYSTAALGLCKVVRRIEKNGCKFDDPLLFIISRIRYEILEYISNDKTISIPHSSYRADWLYTDIKMRNLHENIESKTHNDIHNIGNINMLLDDIRFTPMEKEVVQGRLAGYSVYEIQKQLNTNVGRHIKSIKWKLKEYFNIFKYEE